MFRFTIRDVLWLTVVVALVLGWCLDRGQLALRAQKADATAEIATRTAKHFLVLLEAFAPDWRNRVNHDGDPVLVESPLVQVLESP
jgi:hypothetical protein